MIKPSQWPIKQKTYTLIAQMVKKRFLLSLGVGSLLLLSVPASASALVGDQNSLPGASNAADYQPPTGNPQNDVGGVSQGQTNQNNLQKPDAIDQTALPNVSDLRVSGVNSETNANTTKTEVTLEKGKTTIWAIIMLGTAAVAAVVLIVSTGKGRRTKRTSSSDEEPVVSISTPTKAHVTDTADVTSSSTVHKTTQKKTSKQKKGKGKKTRRKR
jgi:hypothetical protein